MECSASFNVGSEASEEVATKTSSETGDKADDDEKYSCDLCERTFDNLNGMRIHIGKKHGQNDSPIPQLDGHHSDFLEYQFEFEAHEVCTDDDMIEVLNTNFHCTLDEKMIGKADPTRHFVLEKVTERAFKATIKDDQKIVKVIENWKNCGQFDDRAFMSSAQSDITIKIKELRRIV